ncbi:sugar phosphate isomerase/epimerase family protein [Adhaeretor mobilis]|uniref:Xylose isomerase-like TIM barrel n=1 Tax=Adhaeretor mobilis TaxID=1930276 RepID=A0A517MU43_9BACT|nr:TIM barrel protein [Adhaeretor mobilis]QDS98297.1 Xylose isomerase-like TIM barrel [Adhaeretor mobilis]
MSNNYPKLHNAAWPGIVGKGDDSEPPIELDALLDLTAGAEVNGTKFDGIDLILSEPHVGIDSTPDQLSALAEAVTKRGLEIGSLVAPVWPPLGGGSSMGDEKECAAFLGQVEKACQIGAQLRELGVRPNGVIRIDSACDPGSWAADREKNQRAIADTFNKACDIASKHGERLAAEGEICWGGMHSWRAMAELLELVGRPETLGLQADMAHTLLYLMGYNAPDDALLPADHDWSDKAAFYEQYKKLTDTLRPWTIDFHVAQNDATVFGSGSHDKTGRHCLPDDPNGKLDIAEAAGYWLRDESGELTKTCRHICWDGCMFPNETMLNQETWNKVLSAMVSVRDAHGWQE